MAHYSCEDYLESRSPAGDPRGALLYFFGCFARQAAIGSTV